MTWVMHEGVLLSRQGEAFICVSPGCLHENQGLCLGFVMSGTCVAMCHEFYTIEYVFFIPHGSVCRHRYTYHGGPSTPATAPTGRVTVQPEPSEIASGIESSRESSAGV